MFRRAVRTHIGLTGLLLAGCALAPLAQAAETGGSDRLDEVIVTAQKRAENLQDVALAVTALDAAQLQTKGISDVGTLVYALPNLTVTPFPSARPSALMTMGAP